MTDFCPSHAPGSAERLRAQGKRGGEATRRRFQSAGLPAERLGSLDCVEDALRWLEEIAKAVGARELSASEGQTMTGAVREWIKGEDVRLRARDLRDLQAQIRELKGKANMRVVK